MSAKHKVIGNITVGTPDVDPMAPGHVPGITEGNRHHPTQRPNGLTNDSGNRAEGTSRRSTGIRPDEHDRIDPAMPRLSPA